MNSEQSNSSKASEARRRRGIRSASTNVVAAGEIQRDFEPLEPHLTETRVAIDPGLVNQESVFAGDSHLFDNTLVTEEHLAQDSADFDVTECGAPGDTHPTLAHEAPLARAQTKALGSGQPAWVVRRDKPSLAYHAGSDAPERDPFASPAPVPLADDKARKRIGRVKSRPRLAAPDPHEARAPRIHAGGKRIGDDSVTEPRITLDPQDMPTEVMSKPMAFEFTATLTRPSHEGSSLSEGSPLSEMETLADAAPDASLPEDSPTVVSPMSFDERAAGATGEVAPVSGNVSPSRGLLWTTLIFSIAALSAAIAVLLNQL